MKVEDLKWRNNKLPGLYLNLGGRGQHHGVPHYENYISVVHPQDLLSVNGRAIPGLQRSQEVVVDLKTGKRIKNQRPENQKDGSFFKAKPYTVYHDLLQPFPLKNECVDGVLSEDCFEHIEEHHYPKILTEIYRILKKGGLFRLAVPDYRSPKDRFCLRLGFDPRDSLHVTLTTWNLLKKYTHKCPFETVEYQNYWEGDKFIQKKIDYARGYVRRTPDNDPRNTSDRPLHVTSLVVDLIKK